MVYTKRKHQQKSIVQAQPHQIMTDSVVEITKSQSNFLDNKPDQSGNSNDSLAAVVSDIDNFVPSSPILDNLSNDLHLPIALRKGNRSCTNHPLSKHMSYVKLSQTYSSYVAKITNLFIPRDIHEALNNPEWKTAVMKEIHALEKNGTWDLINCLKDKS